MSGQIDFQRVFEEALEAQLLLNTDGVVVTASDGYLRAVGLGRADVVGQPMLSLPPYLNAPNASARFRETFGFVQTSTVSLGASLDDARAPAGDDPWSSAHTRPVRDGRGAIRHFVHVLRGASGVAVERGESQSERRLRKLIEHSYDCVVLRDAYGQIVYISPSIKRLTGYSEAEFAALSPFATVHPDDIARFGDEIAGLRNQPGGVITVQMRTRHRDGSWRTCEIAAVNHLHDPDVAAIVSTFHDVTNHVELQRELRAAGDRLRVALVAARAIAWDVDLVNAANKFSSDHREFFGLPPASSTEFNAALVHPDDRQRVLDATRRCRESGQNLNIEFRGPDLGGPPRWYAAHGQVIRDADDRPVRMIGVTWDISEGRRMRDERAALEQRMQETQKLESLGVLAGGVAHDFNNILMAILGNAQLARLAAGQNGMVLEHLAQIEEASRRAADLCQQMLAYAGKGRFALTHANLNALIEETTNLLQVSISKKAVIRFHLTTPLPSVLADVTQLRQVLMNLVINASDAIGDRSGVISISTGTVRADRPYLERTFLAPEIAEGDYVFVEVSDTGSGMSPETQSRIFEPFFTTKFTGRGLGLAAVLGIARGHKGALKVDSKLGKGSSFKLLLPIVTGASELTALPRRPGAGRSGQGTVLVVDDEATVLAVTRRMLEVIGFRVLTAFDGREALVVYREHRSEIVGVLLDLTMPHLDGEETLRELRKLNPDVRALLMSGYDEQDAIARFAGKGVAGFVQKPFNLDNLRDKLFALLD